MSDGRTELMVIGTVHQYHHGGYSLEHLRAILNAADPDVVCVEIRPVDFEKRDFRMYPFEMSEVGVKWAEERGRPCCPIDWWREDDVKTREAPTAQDLEADFRQLLRWKSIRDMDWRSVNSPESCRRCRELHGTEGSIFDAEPSLWKTRNMEMSALIDGVVRQHPAKRVVVLTGSEHKYWFDEYFEGRPDVQIMQPVALPIPADTGRYTPERLLGAIGAYLEGPNGNRFADYLEVDGLLEDIEYVERSMPHDSCVTYLKGMYYYVVREYEKALSCLAKAEQDSQMTIPLGPFRVPPPGPIALMRCSQVLDLLDRREEALEANRKALATLPADHPWRNLFERRMERPFTR